MKKYDLYVVMSAASDSRQHIEELMPALFNSNLKLTHHVGDKNSVSARRDIARLVGESRALLYVSDLENNQLVTAADAVRQADMDGVPVYVIRLDNSSYPSEIADILANSTVYDAINEDYRADVVDKMIRDLGGNTAPDVTPDERPTTPDARPTTGPETVTDVQDDNDKVISRPQSTWTIVIEVILGIIIIAAIIALAVK